MRSAPVSWFQRLPEILDILRDMDAELDRLGEFLRKCKGGKAMNFGWGMGLKVWAGDRFFIAPQFRIGSHS